MKHHVLLRSVFVALALFAITATVAQAETKIRWYGHAGLRIETAAGAVILIDPWLKNPANPEKEALEKIGRVDYILVTHGHGDHASNVIDIAKKTGAIVVAPYALLFNLKSIGGLPDSQANVFATGGNVGGTIPLPKAGAKVTYVSAIHGSELTGPMVPQMFSGQLTAIGTGNPVGYLLQIDGGPTIYHTGDTEVTSDMKLIPEFFKVDIMFAPIGGFFTMDPVHAALAVEWVNPKQVVPIHFGTFPILTGTPAQFKAALEKRGLGGRMIEMKPGEERAF